MEAAEKGELNELVLLVIWNRLDLARRDVSYRASVSVDVPQTIMDLCFLRQCMVAKAA